LALSLQLAGIGMLLVFGAILLLWAGMSLLARATAARPEPPPPADVREEERRRAAAAAGALALLRARERREFPLPPTAMVSPWQAVMRAAQLRQRGPVR
jgi:hypothetical protein